MKKNSFLFCCCLVFVLLCTSSAISQVYRFKPLYSTTISYDGKDKTYSWNTGKLRSSAGVLSYTFDVDKKQVIFPGAVSPFVTTPITSIERDEQNKRLIFRVDDPQANKYFKQRWHAYIIQFDSDGTTPMYFQDAYNPQDFSSKDSMLTTYADKPRNFPFAVVSNSMKEDTTMATGNRSEKTDALAAALFNKSYNRVEMRAGVVTWAKGKGRDATVERFEVDSVTVFDQPKQSGVLLICHIPGDPEGTNAVIGYVYRNGLHEVFINRYRFHQMVSTTVLKGY